MNHSELKSSNDKRTFDTTLETDLLNDKVALNLLYIQVNDLIKR